MFITAFTTAHYCTLYTLNVHHRIHNSPLLHTIYPECSLPCSQQPTTAHYIHWMFITAFTRAHYCTLYTLNVHHRVHKSPLLHPILGQITLHHTLNPFNLSTLKHPISVGHGADFYTVSSTEYFVARQKCKQSPFSSFHDKTEHFYIADSYTKVNNNTNGTHCRVSHVQWLGVRSTMLCYTSTTCSFSINFIRTTCPAHRILTDPITVITFTDRTNYAFTF